MELKLALETLGASERATEELARLRASLPVELETAERAAEAARETIAAERTRVEECDRSRREHEAAIQDCEAQREKLQGQTALVKTNQEYTALLNEIEGVTARISTTEEQLLVLLEDIEGAAVQLRTIEEEQGRVAADFDKQADALRARIAEVERDLEKQTADRAAVAADLPSEVRARYDRVAGARGSGIARIEGRSCGACHRDVPYETINRVTAGELHLCLSCQRLFILPDDPA